VKFRKGQFKRLRKQVRERHKQRVELAEEFIKAGRFLSPAAFRIFCIIKWYNPSVPSYKEICQFSGYCRQAVSNALEELEIKCLIQRNSGLKHRENNHYLIRPSSEWRLTNSPPLTPSQKQKARKAANLNKRRFHRRTGAMAALATAIAALVAKKDKFDNRTSTSSTIEPVTSSIIERELDQSVTRSINLLGGATRHTLKTIEGRAENPSSGPGKRCPAGQDQKNKAKGVGLSADDIMNHRHLARREYLAGVITFEEYVSELDRLDSLEPKVRSVGMGEKSNFHAASEL
jgi:hypothetical protein